MPRSWLRFTLEALFIVLVAVVAGVVHLSTPGIIAAMAVAWLLVAVYEWTTSKARPARPALETGELEAVERPSPAEPVTAPEPATAEERSIPSLPEESPLGAPVLAAAGGWEAMRRRLRRPPAEAAEAPPPEPEPAPHVRVLGREVAPSPETVEVAPPPPLPEPEPEAQPEAAPAVEPLPVAEEQPPEPEPAPQLQPVPAPPPVPEPEPEPQPAPAAEQVVAMPARGGPQEWNLWDLERLVRDNAGRDALVDEERNYLLMYLRDFANADGVLPVDFDALVRESFGDLVRAPS
jgi:hypothetical protein